MPRFTHLLKASSKFYVFILIAVSVPISSANAATPTFGTATPVNTSGFSTYSFNSLSATPDGSKVIASAGLGYLLYSSDSGTTWSNITSAGIRNWSAVAINDSGTVLAAGVSGSWIYLSTNSGSTWAAQSSGGSGTWNSLDMNSSGTVIAGTTNSTSVSFTSNTGASWTVNSYSNTGGNKSMFVSSNGNRMVFMSTTSGYSYISTDTGTTFTEQTTPGTAIGSYSCLWASRDGLKITFAKTSTSIARSLDGGSTWGTMTITSSVCTGFSASEDMSNIWIGQNGGPSYYSTDSGTTWIATTVTGNQWVAINVNAAGTHWIAALPSNTVYTSDGPPSGLTKRPIYLGAGSWSRSSMSADGSVIAISGNNGEVTISRDSGTTWSSTIGTLGTNSSWSCLAVSGDGNTIYAGGYSVRLWKSSNRGVSWTQTGSDTYTSTAFTANGCATNSDGSKVAVTSTTQGVLISTNSGSSFTQSLSNSFNSTTYVYQTVTMTADGTKWAVNETTANTPIIVNTNSGANGSWTVTSAVPTRPGVDLKSSADGSVLIAGFSGTFNPIISKDWGATWNSITGVGLYFSYGISISANGNFIVLGQSTATTGLMYYSTDKGATFTVLPSDAGYFNTLAVSSNGTNLIYGISGLQLQTRSVSLTAKANFASLTKAANAYYRTQVTLTATLATAGTDGAVTFYANNKPIAGCIKVATTSLVATCKWKPSTRGGVTISVTSYPTDTSFTSGSTSVSALVANRSGTR